MHHLLAVATITLALTLPAYAYLDPGTGSMILQAIVGAVAVAGATASIYWAKVKSFASHAFGKKTDKK
jgi:hypothetical protein